MAHWAEDGRAQRAAAAASGGTTTATAELVGPPAPPATLRIGIIGYGYWGPQLARNFHRPPASVVTHIADLSVERRSAAIQAFPHVQVLENLNDVLESDVDAVVIATPIRTHHPLARRALEHGKHVFVEKPLAASVAEASDLVAVAESADRTLMVGHTFMYNPAVEQLRGLIQTNTLGRVLYIDATRLNLGLFQPDFNVLWDLAPHDLSILSYILGTTPVSVSVHAEAFVRAGVHDIAHAILRYPDSVLAHIHVSWLHPSKVRRITVVGDRQMAVYDDVEATEKIRIFNRGVEAPEHTSTFGEFQLSYRYGDVISPYIHWSEPLAVECQHFVDAVRSGSPPASDGPNGLQVVRVLEAMQQSLHAGGAEVAISPLAGESEAGAK